jgi:hypothetical protein
MALALPQALSNFSQTALKSVQNLQAITQSLPSIQGQIRSNIVNAATTKITGVGSLFEDASDFVSESVDSFHELMAGPATLSQGVLSSVFEDVFGTNLVSGQFVNDFIEANVRFENVIPAQQLFQIVQNFASNAIFSDPLQAYTAIAKAALNIKNLVARSASIAVTLSSDIASLLTLQSSINYAEMTARNQQFFQDSKQKILDVNAKFGQLKATFDIRGKYDATEVAALCTAINGFDNFVTFANTKALEYERLRVKINDTLDEARALGRNITTLSASIRNHIGKYVSSTDFGKMFQKVQGDVIKAGEKSLEVTIAGVTAAADRASLDARTALSSSYRFASQLQGIKAFICGLDPSNDVTGAPEFSNLNTGYNVYSSVLQSNETDDDYEQLEDETAEFKAAMRVGTVRDNSADLAAKAASITSIIGSLNVAFAAIETASGVYNTLFSSETADIAERVTSGTDLMDNLGLDSMSGRSITDNFDEITDLPFTDSTSEGELMQSVADEIKELPDGNERDNLIRTYNDLLAKQQAKAQSMDFQRRLSVDTLLAQEEEEESVRDTNETVKTFAPDDYDDLVTPGRLG